MYAVECTINRHLWLEMNERMEMSTDDGRDRKRANIAVKSYSDGTMIEVSRKNGENMNEKDEKPAKFCLFFISISLFLSFISSFTMLSLLYLIYGLCTHFIMSSTFTCEVMCHIPEKRCYLEGIVFPLMVFAHFAMPSVENCCSFRRMSADLSGDGSTGYIPVGISAYPQLLLVTLLDKSHHDALESPGNIVPKSCASALIVAEPRIASTESAANLQHIFQMAKSQKIPQFLPVPEKYLHHSSHSSNFSRLFQSVREKSVELRNDLSPNCFSINKINGSAIFVGRIL